MSFDKELGKRETKLFFPFLSKEWRWGFLQNRTGFIFAENPMFSKSSLDDWKKTESGGVS